jgi:hypothetical protein
VARRRRRRRHLAANPHRRRRHHHRNPVARRRTYRRRRHRNPFGISTSGITGQLTRGAKNGLGVLTGRVTSRWLPDLTGLSTSIASSSMGSGVATLALAGLQLASGILVGMLVKGMAGGEFASYVVAGAFDGVYEDVATSFSGSVPVIGKYLGGYSHSLPAVAGRALGGYSRTPTAATARGGMARVGSAALRRIGVGAAARVAR